MADFFWLDAGTSSKRATGPAVDNWRVHSAARRSAADFAHPSELGIRLVLFRRCHIVVVALSALHARVRLVGCDYRVSVRWQRAVRVRTTLPQSRVPRPPRHARPSPDSPLPRSFLVQSGRCGGACDWGMELVDDVAASFHMHLLTTLDSGASGSRTVSQRSIGEGRTRESKTPSSRDISVGCGRAIQGA